MLDTLTQDHFAPHVGTKFPLKVPERTLDLLLVDVRILGPRPARLVKEGQRAAAFALTFRGPADAFLGQATREVVHPVLGPLSLFLVPVGREEAGFLYEAVFN